ncbi:ABC transporter permease [Mesorhizobium microcysteis]|uniref:ABC transporter permease n=1 Tax=Neoaquamicrobium microcysteis TaxID=2682781 RepID=A0A5D4H087_9HYPH|nr:ABC transporter permease [Mesorhizobium microcysteis]TYR34038.1 ABC transporter permease [Mesorhizobium microcysteis]
MSETTLRRLFAVATPLLLIGAWWAYVTIFNVPRFVLPPPDAVFSELVRLFTSGTIWPHLAHTVGVIVAGFAIGSAAGFALGFALGKWPRIERIVGPYLFFFQTAPKIALAPLFILWFGLGLTSKIVLTVSLVFFPVMVGTILGLRSVPANLHSLCAILKLSQREKLVRVELPAAVPEIFAGLKVAAVQATIGAILAEWLSGGTGLGYLMVFAGTTYKTPLLFAMVLVTSLLGIAVYQALALTEKWLLSWR